MGSITRTTFLRRMAAGALAGMLGLWLDERNVGLAEEPTAPGIVSSGASPAHRLVLRGTDQHGVEVTEVIELTGTGAVESETVWGGGAIIIEEEGGPAW